MTRDERYRRLLRWYPRAWRHRNGDVLLGTMLDDAERRGRSTPSAEDRLSAVGHGLGTRLDGRFALGAALAALATAAAAGAISVWAIVALSAMGWVLPVLTIAVGPTLISAGVVALARHRGVVSGPRAVLLLSLALVAWALAAVAQVSWGQGFDAADRGVESSGFASVWPWLAIAAWVAGAAAVAMLMDSLLRRSRLHRSASATLAIFAGVVLAPVLGLSAISPYTTAIAAAGLAMLSIVSDRTSSRSLPAAEAPATVPPAVASDSAEVPARTLRLARGLAIVTATVSAAGVLFALTGSQWGGEQDATLVMGRGIAIALLAAVPLLAAIGAVVAARGRVRAVHTWGPLTLVALAMASVALAYRGAPAWDGMVVGFAIASALGGAAIAWWLAPRLRASPRSRIAISVLVGVAYAAFLGIMVAPMLAFALPLLAAAFAIWGARRPRRNSGSEKNNEQVTRQRYRSVIHS